MTCRPTFLALDSATSTRRISVEPSSPCSGASATPTVAPASMVSPASGYDVDTAARSDRASSAAAAASGTRVTTANSSAPTRATIASAGELGPQPAADQHQQLVAPGVPERVVDLLEAVQVELDQRHHAVAAGLDRPVDVLAQLRPGGQVGQLVVVRRVPQPGDQLLVLQGRGEVGAEVVHELHVLAGERGHLALPVLELQVAADSGCRCAAGPR